MRSKLVRTRLLAVALLAGSVFVDKLPAQTGTLAEPFPPPAPNAALHYQRAMLYAAALDPDETKPLEQPIWELLPEINKQAFSGDIGKLLYKGRFAVRAASSGARLEQCDFGIDFRDHGAATPLPHAQPMLQLGRLLTLRGAYEQAQGKPRKRTIVQA